MPISVRLSPSWSSAAARFRQPVLSGILQSWLSRLGDEAVRVCADATPIGRRAKPAGERMRARWRSDVTGSGNAVRVYNTAPYAHYVAQRNAALQQALTQDVPRLAQQAGSDILGDLATHLAGEG